MSELAVESLNFPDASFDVILTRHAPVFVPEIDRVTRPGGRFVCQGIGSRNMANIRQAFGTGSATLYDDEHARDIDDLKARGWEVLVTGMYDVRYRVKDMPSLLFWFKAIAGANEVPADFSVVDYGDAINAIVEQWAGPRGLETNEHRTLVIAKKPDA